MDHEMDTPSVVETPIEAVKEVPATTVHVAGQAASIPGEALNATLSMLNETMKNLNESISAVREDLKKTVEVAETPIAKAEESAEAVSPDIAPPPPPRFIRRNGRKVARNG